MASPYLLLQFVFILCISATLVSIHGSSPSELSEYPKSAENYSLPPILGSCLSPLNSSAAARWARLLSSYGGNRAPSKTLISTFCREAGLICDEDNSRASETPIVLYSLSSYRMPVAKNQSSKLAIAAADSKQKAGLFFAESHLRRGSKLTLPDPHPSFPTRPFLPRQLEQILFDQPADATSRLLGFHPGSSMAASMRATWTLCSAPPRVAHETRACVASRESMEAFARASLGGSDVAVLAAGQLPRQRQVVVGDVRELTWPKGGAVACHNSMFPFQVFYCHSIRGTTVFHVTLHVGMGDNRMTQTVLVSALASCHMLGDLSNLPIFSNLQLSPGERICHWNYGDNIVWVPSSPNLTNVQPW